LGRHAAERRRGADLDEVVALVEGARDKVQVYGSLDTLDNLRYGGRIGKAKAFFGSLSPFKPSSRYVTASSKPNLSHGENALTRAPRLQVIEAGEVDQVAVVTPPPRPTRTRSPNMIARKSLGSASSSATSAVIGSHAGPRQWGLLQVEVSVASLDHPLEAGRAPLGRKRPMAVRSA